MTNRRRVVWGLALIGATCGLTSAQRGGGRGFGGGFGGGYGGYGRANAPITDLPANRVGVATWEVDPAFAKDTFTFVRLRFTSGEMRLPDKTGDGWKTDWPNADLNFSFRLQQMTSIKVDPYPRQIEITDDALFDYPFVYMEQVGRLEFTDEEVIALRRYLLNGGFLEVGDHWGPYEYESFRQQMKRVFPDRDPRNLPIEHPIFHCIFDLKSKPQIPEMYIAVRNMDTGVTWERDDAKEPFFRGIFDDHDRMMVIICSNTDLSDGWEQEGSNEWFFHEFSEKKAYPMGINIIFYAMTH